MTVAWGAHGTAGTGTTSCTPAYPTGLTAGQMLLMQVVSKYPPNGPATPAGWTLVLEQDGGQGAQGADSGPVRVSLFCKVADGTESGNETVSVPSGNSVAARISRYTKDAAKVFAAPAAVGGADADASSTTFQVTGGADLGLIAGDLIAVFAGMNTDLASYSGQTISATGATFGTFTERIDTPSSQGDDQTHVYCTAPVTAGPSTAAPVFMTTASVGTPTGAAVFVRLREITAFVEGVSETVTVSEAAAAVMATASTMTEEVTLTEATTISAGLPVAASESVAVADAGAASAGLMAPAGETVALAEALIVRPWRVGHRARVRILAGDGDAL